GLFGTLLSMRDTEKPVQLAYLFSNVLSKMSAGETPLITLNTALHFLTFAHYTGFGAALTLQDFTKVTPSAVEALRQTSNKLCVMSTLTRKELAEKILRENFKISLE